MKKDAAPLSLRRPFVRLSRSLITPRVKALLQQHASPERVAAAIPVFDRRDPQGPWGVFYAEMFNAFADIMEAAGRAARVRKAVVARAPEITVPLNPYSQKWIKGHAGELCVELSKQQHKLVRESVRAGYEAGARPEQIAAQLSRTVGLTERQENAVQNFWQQTAMEESEDIADVRAERYAQTQLAYRTEMIARTENRYAVEQGRMNEWLQARDGGELPETVKRVWVSAPSSDRLCDACEEMNGQAVGLEEEFVSKELGESVDAPPLHPQCRCTVVLDVVDIVDAEVAEGEES